MKRITILAAVLVAVSLIFNQPVRINSAAAAETMIIEHSPTENSLAPAQSTSISEIVEIKNNTSDTYFMYVWDNEHEGRYLSYKAKKDNWYYPDEGKWLEIKPGAHIRADDCGIPDSGKSAGKDRVRVIFKAKRKGQRPSQGDPDYGLRVNRVGQGNGNDTIVFRDHATAKKLSETEIPTKMHQSLILIIDNDGVKFEQKEMVVSGEHKVKEGFKKFGEAMKLGAEVFAAATKFIP